MTIERFFQLWTHRYHKYSHIFTAYALGLKSWMHFRIRKSELKKGQRLVAIVRTEHFGDIVAAEPLSRYIRSLYPDDYIVWFVKPSFNELVGSNPAINETFQEFCVTQRKVLLGTGVFDALFDLQFKNNNHCPKCAVFLENPVAEARGINVHTYFNFGNLLDVFAKTCGIIAPDAHFPADDHPRLYLNDAHRMKADSLDLPVRFIVVHCQSNYAPKDWPAGRWNLLIGWVAATYHFHIIEIGLKSSLSVQGDFYRNLCGQLSIPETAEVIRRGAYFIGLDSGPSHLANAVGTPGIILMGSLGDFPSYNPYSGSYGRQENAVFVRENGKPCSELTLEYVKDKIEKVLGNP